MSKEELEDDYWTMRETDAINNSIENKKLKQQIADLEAKLAEKDKEIAYLTKQVKKFNNEAQKYFEDAYCNDFHNQDKISFCVEKLEKVKEFCDGMKWAMVHLTKENTQTIQTVLDEIDNQIKQLTHQQEDKGDSMAKAELTIKVRDLEEVKNELKAKDQRIAELEEQLKNAIVPKFKIGDYFIEYWNKELNIYQYQGDKHFKCLNKKQGYHCDYVILGALLLEEDFIQPISKDEAQAKLKELQGE